MDRVETREFVVAADELHLGAARRVARVSGQRDVESMPQHARAWSLLTGEDADLVLYPAQGPRNEWTRRLLTREVLARLEPGANALGIASAVGAHVGGAFAFVPDHFTFTVTEPGAALAVAEKLRGMRGVVSAEAQLARQAAKKLAPNDAFFPQQWHLLNTGQSGGTAGIDVNITNVWDSLRGTNIVIGIVDDGLQLTHPDLAPNVNTNLDWDFNFSDSDPSPNLGFDYHGTSVAGVAGARGHNINGVAGAACESTLVGLRLIAAATSDAQEAAAMSHSNAVIHIKNNSWGAPDCYYDPGLEGGGPLWRAAVRDGVRTGRGGRGVLYLWAGGNGGDCDEDVNYDGYANFIDVIAVAALSDQGQQADYSEPGACLIVTAPSSSSGRQEIVTTDLVGQNGYNYIGAGGELADTSYTRTFGGTSSATPLVSGILALVLEANTNLGHRDVKEILLRSSTRVQPSDSDWKTNSAGILHNHKFGGGLINARAAVDLATNWAGLGPRTNVTLLQTNLGISIPDDNPAGVARSFTFTNPGFRVENVTVTMTLPHAYWGDVVVTLTSPSGMPSRLATEHGCDTGYSYQAWTFNSVRHWGEQADGIWTVKVSDESAVDVGVLNALEVTLHGSIPSAALHLAPTNSDMCVTLSTAAAGWRYAIDSAAHLSNGWSQTATLAVPTSGQVSFTDTNALSCGRRFYRARLLP